MAISSITATDTSLAIAGEIMTPLQGAPVKSEPVAALTAEQRADVDKLFKDLGIRDHQWASRETAPQLFKALDEARAGARQKLGHWTQPDVHEVIIMPSLRGESPAAYLTITGLEGRDGLLLASTSAEKTEPGVLKFIVAHEYGHGLIHKNQDRITELANGLCVNMTAITDHADKLRSYIQSQSAELTPQEKTQAYNLSLYRQLDEIIADSIGVKLTGKAASDAFAQYIRKEPDLPQTIEEQVNRLSWEQILRPSEAALKAATPEERARVNLLQTLSAIAHPTVPARLEMLNLPAECSDLQTPSAAPHSVEPRVR